jgi:hypothetical protein
MNTSFSTPLEFIGVYDADSTVIGEISYWLKARLGKGHCSLCELTHGMFVKKSEWKSCESQLPIPFQSFHRNDAPEDVLKVANGQFPLVLARYAHGLEIVLTRNELEKFNGDTAHFHSALLGLLRS